MTAIINMPHTHSHSHVRNNGETRPDQWYVFRFLFLCIYLNHRILQFVDINSTYTGENIVADIDSKQRSRHHVQPLSSHRHHGSTAVHTTTNVNMIAFQTNRQQDTHTRFVASHKTLSLHLTDCQTNFYKLP